KLLSDDRNQWGDTRCLLSGKKVDCEAEPLAVWLSLLGWSARVVEVGAGREDGRREGGGDSRKPPLLQPLQGWEKMARPSRSAGQLGADLAFPGEPEPTLISSISVGVTRRQGHPPLHVTSSNQQVRRPTNPIPFDVHPQPHAMLIRSSSLNLEIQATGMLA